MAYSVSRQLIGEKMTDENLSAEGLPSDGSVGEVSPSQDSSSEHVGTQAQIDQEKSFTQSELNDISGTVRRKSFDKGFEAGLSQSQQETRSHHDVANANGAASFNESKVRELVNTQLAEISKNQQATIDKHRIDEQAAQIFKSIDASAEAAKEKIPDFVEVMESVNGFVSTPGILSAVHTLDNSAEVLHYLAKNPSKIPALAALSSDVNMSKAAASELKVISDRLKQNDNAKNSPSAPNPISQIDTNVRDGIGGSEPDSIADFKEIYTG